MKPAIWLYDVRDDRGNWQARVIITSDGCIFVRSWWGSFAHFWNGPGEPMREFILGCDAGYLANKLENRNEKKPRRGCQTSAEEFCEHVLPRLKEVLREDLAREAAAVPAARPTASLWKRFAKIAWQSAREYRNAYNMETGYPESEEPIREVQKR